MAKMEPITEKDELVNTIARIGRLLDDDCKNQVLTSADLNYVIERLQKKSKRLAELEESEKNPIQL